MTPFPDHEPGAEAYRMERERVGLPGQHVEREDAGRIQTAKGTTLSVAEA